MKKIVHFYQKGNSNIVLMSLVAVLVLVVVGILLNKTSTNLKKTDILEKTKKSNIELERALKCNDPDNNEDCHIGKEKFPAQDNSPISTESLTP